MDAKRVPFVDLSFQWREIATDVRSQFDRLFEASQFCLGPAVEKFERAFAELLGVKHVVAVNSGTSALHLAVLVAGLGPGDEVLLPSHTFIATAWGPIYAGATPVFCDVLPGCGTIDLQDAEMRLTPRTRAIIPVHIYGQPCKMAAVEEFASNHRLIVIEDAAQAVCARWRDGRRIGAIGALGCFSFYPGKNLGAAGEGGAVATSDDAYAAVMRALRDHGQVERCRHERIGFNYRMDGLQGAVLHRKMVEIERWTERRRVIARRYCKRLADCGVELPALDGRDHVFHLFVVREKRRDELQRHLAACGIGTGLHYPIPLHRQPCLTQWASSTDSFKVADEWADRGLSLPIFYGMTDEQADRVIAAVKSFYADQHKAAPGQSLACRGGAAITRIVPSWAEELLCCPETRQPLVLTGDILCRGDGTEIARCEGGVVRIPISNPDSSTKFYRQIGGAHFHQRRHVPFAMSALDTPIYHAHLERFCCADRRGVVVDIGGGDGRNAEFFVEQGFERIVVVDAVAEALMRFRERVAERDPQALDRLLLIEADVRSLPLVDACATNVVAIEVLYYLNEDYEIGLTDAARVLARGGRAILSERDYEGGLVSRLFYHGVGAMTESSTSRDLWDGTPDALVRTRCFTEDELLSTIRCCGLDVKAVRGIPLIPLILGWMRGRNLLSDSDAEQLPAVMKMLADLGAEGRLRRCHLVVAEHNG